eukprot:6203730-Pleurochrysis_carterae.AAC.1
MSSLTYGLRAVLCFCNSIRHATVAIGGHPRPYQAFLWPIRSQTSNPFGYDSQLECIVMSKVSQ